jgi:hypothetical protein
MSPKFHFQRAILLWPAAVVLILACSVTGSAQTNAPAFDPTKAALELQATSLSLQLTQVALSGQQQATQPPAPTAPAVPTQLPAPTGIPPTPAPDLEAQIKSARILVYENTDASGIGMWVQDALNGMGLQYTQTGSYSGHFMENLDSGTKWDLIIVDAEAKDIISGEFWGVINTRLGRDKAALIVEIWYLHNEANGPISQVLSRCGVRFLKAHPLADSIYWWVPDHPIFNEPNRVLPLLHGFRQFWSIASGGDGDRIGLGSGGDATLLAGNSSSPSNDGGVLATCDQGRVIIQTFSDHDYSQADILPLWQNYIHYTLKNHFAVSP